VTFLAPPDVFTFRNTVFIHLWVALLAGNETTIVRSLDAHLSWNSDADVPLHISRDRLAVRYFNVLTLFFWNLLTVLPGDLVTLLPGHLFVDSGALLPGNVLTLRHDRVVAHLLRHDAALPPRHRDRHVATLLLADRAALLVLDHPRHLFCHLPGHLLAHGLDNSLALLLLDRYEVVLHHRPTQLLGNLFTDIVDDSAWHVLALLFGHVLADLFRNRLFIEELAFSHWNLAAVLDRHWHLSVATGCHGTRP